MKGIHYIIAAALLLLAPVSGWATGNVTAKLALVIGNQRYTGDKPLPNAISDASLMSQTLNKLGFTVTQRTDLKREEMVAAVNDFAARIPEGATALVYYAGHGMQIGGSSFLNPVDMAITSEQHTPLRAYPLKTLLESLSKTKSAVNIVVLDACRNNPFRVQESIRYRSFGNLGLSRVEAPRGTLIAYSTMPGQLAADGTGSNSVYTSALVKIMQEPDREIEEIFKMVSTEVRRKTLDDQIPWYESSITDRYYLKPPEGTTVIAGKPLSYAQGDKAHGTVVRRSLQVAPPRDEQWFRQLSAGDWSQIDWELQQRVKRMTPDEISMLEHKASGGNVMSQTVLGLVYREGIDKATDQTSGRTLRFKADNTKALKWIRKAAESGFPVAQAELGEMYYRAHGVDRSLEKSRQWLEQAALAEYPRAKLDLLQLDIETNPKGANPHAAMRTLIDSLTTKQPLSGNPLGN